VNVKKNTNSLVCGITRVRGGCRATQLYIICGPTRGCGAYISSDDSVRGRPIGSPPAQSDNAISRPTPASERLLVGLHPILSWNPNGEVVRRSRQTGLLSAPRHRAGSEWVRSWPALWIIPTSRSRSRPTTDRSISPLRCGHSVGRAVADNMAAARVTERSSASSLGRRPISPTIRYRERRRIVTTQLPWGRTLSGRIDPWRFVCGEQEFPIDGTIIPNDVEIALHTALSGGGLPYQQLCQSCSHSRHAAGTASVDAQTITWLRPVLSEPMTERRSAPMAGRLPLRNLSRERFDFAPSREQQPACLSADSERKGKGTQNFACPLGTDEPTARRVARSRHGFPGQENTGWLLWQASS
jgi:hypothetical protein